MSDFLKWLYPHYIKPHLDAAPQDGYELWLSLMESEIPPDLRDIHAKTLEFTAIQSFLLGLRTGQGLPS